MADMFLTGLLLLSSAHLTVCQVVGTCGSPELYANAHLEDLYAQRSQFNHGDKVKYKCAVGYVTIPGSTRVSYCERGQWSPISLQCAKKKCSSAGEILNGHIKYEGNLFGDAVYAECNEGYVLKGDDVRHCLADGWSGSPPICEVAAIPTVTCSPPHKKSATFHGTKAAYKPGESISYSCNDGFRQNGINRELLCDDLGRWRPATPNCEKIKCPEFQVDGGTVSKNNLRFNTNATITCRRGYRLRGARVVTCAMNSSWVPAVPICEPGVSLSRVKVTCPPPAVPNSLGQVRNKMSYNVGERATIVCQDGFELSGSSEITCGQRGQWHDTPECHQVMSTPERCLRPPYFANAYARHELKDQYSDGENIEYICHVGHRFAGGLRRIECRNGRWTKLDMRCEKKKCGSAGEIENGQFRYSGASFGDMATAQCNEGYQLVGPEIRTCTAYGWDGRVPVCEAVMCPDPPRVPGAEVFVVADGPIRYRNTASYRCRYGMLIGDSDIYCTRDGTWSEPLPRCRVS
ncbi:sushi, von Willebrand factor type A, EGF and pentraxin domain-containing protein 1 isoform X2 [Trichomycterus rosablanca]|uniref:sushi, von Willebrand factor type A, EGF and pentraxin domain-containing protein 1 isoform X2 n=1 Tax=Trichomycterus rosablanca TaxID=2290929 RepID=UPI002F3517D2